jgi:hypothetical protein
MNASTRYFILFAAMAVCVAALPLTAQTWVNVYDSAHGGVGGVSGDIGTDAAGNVYAVGRYIAADASSVAIVQGSADQGATWQVLDQYPEPGLNYAHNRAFAADPLTGALFAGGNLNNLLPNGTYEFDALWFIREWNPLTGLWDTAEDYVDIAASFGEASVSDIKVTEDGEVYAAGGGAYTGWVVRRRSPNDSTFVNVDVVAASSPGTGASRSAARRTPPPGCTGPSAC